MSFKKIGAVWKATTQKGMPYFKGEIVIDNKKYKINLLPFLRDKIDYDKDPTKDPAYTISLVIKDDQDPVQPGNYQPPKPYRGDYKGGF